MTSELTLPLTVLVVGASDATLSHLHSAVPPGEAEVVVLRELALSGATQKEFIDLCIVDAATDHGAGMQAVRRVRQRWPTVGICCVGCSDVVAALAEGADDAMPLGAPADVVVAQISAAFRRARIASAQLRVAFGDVVYDREARRVWCAGREVQLTPRELRLFDILFLRAGAPVSLEMLREYVWSDDAHPASNALAVYVSYLRRKLRGSRLAVVETMRGIGYRLTHKSE
jgi:two-component system response regulator MprA